MPVRRTMDAKIDRFIAHLETERGLAVNTVAAYRSDLFQFHDFVSSRGRESWGVPSADIRAFMADLIQREYQSSSQARKLAAVKAFYRWLLAGGAIGTDPTASLGGTRVAKRRPRIVSAAEVERLLRQTTGEPTPERLRDSAMLEALYATGMRVSELVALDVGNFDREDRALELAQSRAHARRVPVSDRAADALAAYLDDGRVKLLRRAAEQAMFLNHRGSRLTRQGFWLIIKGYARKAKIATPITPHTLRHSFATHRLQGRGNLREVQRLLGHASPATTQIYAELAREHPGEEDASAVASG